MFSARCLIRPCASSATSTISRKGAIPPAAQSRSAATLPSLKIYSFRRRIAERVSNKFEPSRVEEIGPDLACLEWLMQCGSTKVHMSDGEEIRSIREMKKYVTRTVEGQPSVINKSPLTTGDLAYEKKYPSIPPVHIVKVDASDSAISNSGFRYFGELRRLEGLKMNFCDYFGDEALRELAMGRPAQTLRSIEIVLNPCLSDGAVYWLSRLKSLRSAHFYFLPYVTNRTAFIRQLRMALPKCQITFPEVSDIGYGYDQKEKKSR